MNKQKNTTDFGVEKDLKAYTRKKRLKFCKVVSLEVVEILN